MQRARVEHLSLRHFGRSKPDLRKAGAPRGLTQAEQEAALSGAVRGHIADERALLRGARTVANIDRAHREFSDFLLQWRTNAAGQWATCTPELVLVYLRDVVSQRTGRDGAELTASTLRQLVSNLSMCFCKIGRSEPWDELDHRGNPAASSLVRNHVEMAERRQHANGVRERSAVPVTLGVVGQLLRHLDACETAAGAQPSVLEQLRCARDAALLALLWHSGRRGADLLRLGWHHVYAQGTRPVDSSPILSYWREGFGAAELPSGILLTLDELKNAKRLRPLSVEVTTEPIATADLCAVRRLRHLLNLQRRHGEPEGQPVFCSYATVNPPRTALTTSGFANRFDRFATAALPSSGPQVYTVHGLRRGRMQHERDAGGSVPDIMQLAGLSTESVAHMYLDPGRHLA